MDWPLPSFSINEEGAKSWLKEYIGETENFDQIDGQIVTNMHYFITDGIAYLTYGQNDFNSPENAANERKANPKID